MNKNALSAFACWVCIALYLATMARIAAAEPTPNPAIISLNDTDVERELADPIKAIKDFLRAALRNDRVAAAEYASQKVYKTPQEDKIKLFEYWLDQIHKNATCAKVIFISNLKSVRLNGAPAFETNVEVICDASGFQSKILPIDMIWIREGDVYRCVVLGDLEANIIIDSK